MEFFLKKINALYNNPNNKCLKGLFSFIVI